MQSMPNIKVELGVNSYEVRIGPGALAQAGLWLKEIGLDDKAVIITDTTVKRLYAGALEKILGEAGFNVSVLAVPAGEEHKNLKSAGRLYNELNEDHAERTTPVLALGGGVIGDLAGFVAATFMRGVPLVQVPTTLLAMVDSSVGGKTAVDHGRLKNTVGTFYQPKLVIADIDTLKTLPPAELSNGMAEAIKHAAIGDRELFDYLDDNMGKALTLDAEIVENIVAKNVRIKAGVVARDEKEAGLRAILNYGHTVGHAVEAVSGFKLKHGQAVAIGMVAEAKISQRLGTIGPGEVARLENIIRKGGLPTRIPGLERRKLMQAMSHDKKVRLGRVRFVLLKSIGEAFITDDVPPALVEEVLAGE